MHYLLHSRRRGVGDILSVSALVRDVHNHLPDIRLSVATGEVEDAIYLHDHRVGPRTSGAVEVVIDHKPLHDRSKTDRAARYCYAPHEEFERATGLVVPRGPNTPSIVLHDDEVVAPTDPYGVIAAGVKSDIPIKQWPPAYWAAVVGRLPEVRWVQAGAWRDDRRMHRQPLIPGCHIRVGRTSLRELFVLIAGATVVVGHVSMPMLVASAFGVPCVVVAGGREDPWQFDSPRTTVLHTIGQLDCCPDHGCRRVTAVKAHDQSDFPKGWLCDRPVVVGGCPVGECMRLVTPDQVVHAVKQSLTDCHNSKTGTLARPSYHGVSQ